MWRCRVVLFIALAVLAVSGYWLRFYAPIGPEWRDHSGGAAYVIFWIIAYAFLRPGVSALRVAIVVLVVTCFLEFLQLWHPAWLEAIRRTWPGRLLLGTTFQPSDFPPYFAGAVLGFGLLWLIQKPFHLDRSGISRPN